MFSSMALMPYAGKTRTFSLNKMGTLKTLEIIRKHRIDKLE